MKGIFFALLGGVFITLQEIANSRISQAIGTWQTAMLTQFTGFIFALLLFMFFRDGKRQSLKNIKPLYLTGGMFGAIVIFNNVTAIQRIGITVTMAAVLTAQLLLTFIVDSNGWFGIVKKKMRMSHFIGIGMIIAGIVMLGF